jgi:hypothetical protein
VILIQSHSELSEAGEGGRLLLHSPSLARRGGKGTNGPSGARVIIAKGRRGEGKKGGGGEQIVQGGLPSSTHLVKRHTLTSLLRLLLQLPILRLQPSVLGRQRTQRTRSEGSAELLKLVPFGVEPSDFSRVRMAAEDDEGRELCQGKGGKAFSSTTNYWERGANINIYLW